MRIKLIVILELLWSHEITKYDALVKILALIADNKQGVSDSPAENSALPRVGECNASGADTTEHLVESEHGTLDNITDTERFVCPHGLYCKQPCMMYGKGTVGYCY